TDQLHARKVDLQTYALLAALLLFASLVKYPFLPVVLAVVVYVAYMLWRTFRGGGLWRTVAKSYAQLSRRTAILLLVLLAVSGVLFVQRYGTNVLAYGKPVPDCDQVLSVDACMEYGPFGRNYLLAAQGPDVDPNPIAYTWTWLQGLHYRLFFMVA